MHFFRVSSFCKHRNTKQGYFFRVSSFCKHRNTKQGYFFRVSSFCKHRNTKQGYFFRVSSFCKHRNTKQGYDMVTTDMKQHWHLGSNVKYCGAISTQCPWKIFKLFSRLILVDGWNISCKLALKWMSPALTDRKVNIGLDNSLVLSGNMPLPVQMLTQIYDASWRH